MALSPGQIYTITKVPMTLYASSDRAARKDTSQSGTITKAGDYRIDPNALVHWTNANGDWLTSEPASGGIALYPIQQKPYGTWYTIGWVRDDDNIQGITIHEIPSQISTNDANYKLSLRGSKGIAYTYTAKIGTREIYTTSTTLTYANTIKTFDLTSTVKNNIYAALGTKSTGTMNITVQSKHNNQVIRTSTASITVIIPSGGNPTWVTTPKVEIVGAIGGKAYQNISRIKVTNGTLSYKDGASFKSISITASGYTSSTSPYTTPIISSTGNRAVRVVVTDTRNRTVSHDATVNFLAAKGLSVTQFTASRLTNNTVKIDGRGSFTSAIEGTPKYKIERRVRGTTTWTETTPATNVTVSGTNFSLTKTYATTVFDSTKSYDIRLTVTGSSSSVAVQTVVGTESVPFSFGKHGAGAGTMFDNNLTHNLQIGTGGLVSQGPIKAASGSNEIEITAGSGLSFLKTTSTTGFHMNKSLFVTGNVFANNKKLALSEEVPTITRGSWYTVFDYADGTRVMNFRSRVGSSLPNQRYGSWRWSYPLTLGTVQGATGNLVLPQTTRPAFDLATQLYNVTTSGFSFEVVSMAVVTTPLSQIMLEGHYINVIVWGTR